MSYKLRFTTCISLQNLQTVFYASKIGYVILLLSVGQTSHAQTFTDYFETSRLRVNLMLAGNAERQCAYLESLNEEPVWGGSQTHLIDRFHYGDYFVKVFSGDGQLIYSRGFCSLFSEWRTTREAQTLARASALSLTLPMPKTDVRIEVLERDKQTGDWQPLFETRINPLDKQIRRGVAPYRHAVRAVRRSGEPAVKVDLAVIAEGYRQDEIEKFHRDVVRLTDYLFTVEPFASHRDDFNIWAVEAVSAESGTDMPHRNSWKNTAANTTFFTFGIDRYLTAPDHTRLCELAWDAPYDILYVLVNTDQYGGGGIYNFYSLCTSDHPQSQNVFVHELGHTFAGLGDEYYTSEVTYEHFYNLRIEPWEPNLTTLVDFDGKWNDLVHATTPVPTPAITKYADRIGVFEGGGYTAKGLFRPAVDCRMKSNATPVFCPVCRRAIEQVIKSYTGTSSPSSARE
ncbi:MAG: IgA Peptidase M64 [Prevotellaceae bacterium]|jgi:hypothetical protein|nr:IgA Peptidase M64 [Prevotellaceae bacterium]